MFYITVHFFHFLKNPFLDFEILELSVQLDLKCFYSPIENKCDSFWFFTCHKWNVEKLTFNLGQLECKLAGWGVTDLEDPKSSQHLMEVKLPWLQRNRFCHVSHFCDNFVTMTSQKTVFRDECNRLFDRDPSTSWIQITNDNLCFGQAAGGIDACQVKKCFACQVITSNKHSSHWYRLNDSCHMRHRCWWHRCRWRIVLTPF